MLHPHLNDAATMLYSLYAVRRQDKALFLAAVRLDILSRETPQIFAEQRAYTASLNRVLDAALCDVMTEEYL